MDSAEFHAAVYHAVRQIPFGRVTSYGHIAKLIGCPNHARHVGQALKFLDEGTDVPWQRVVSASGKISSRGPGTTGAQRQREALEQENVEVRVTREGEFVVKWAGCGWFPERLEHHMMPGTSSSPPAPPDVAAAEVTAEAHAVQGVVWDGVGRISEPGDIAGDRDDRDDAAITSSTTED